MKSIRDRSLQELIQEIENLESTYERCCIIFDRIDDNDGVGVRSNNIDVALGKIEDAINAIKNEVNTR